MKKRFKEMEAFLRELMTQAENGEKVDERVVYTKLKNYGMSKEDYSVTEEEEKDCRFHPTAEGREEWFRRMGFFSFIEGYSRNPDNKSMEVTVNKREQYFLPFHHSGVLKSRCGFPLKFPVKLYIPVGKKDSLDFILKLIKYMYEGDIWNDSKLSADIRTDDLVVRLYTQGDAKKVIDFANANAGDTLLQTNPFLIKKGKVGLASDGKQSFNRMLSNLIADYIEDCKTNNKATKCGVEDFREYLEQIYKTVYKEGKNTRLVTKYPNRSGSSRQLLDMKVILETLLLSTDPEKNADDYLKYWNSIYGIEKDERVKEEIEKLVWASKRAKSEFKGFPELKSGSRLASSDNKKYKAIYAKILAEEKEEQRKMAERRKSEIAEDIQRNKEIQAEYERKEAERKKREAEENARRIQEVEEGKKRAKQAHIDEMAKRRKDPKYQERYRGLRELRDAAKKHGDAVMADNLSRLLGNIGADGVDTENQQKKKLNHGDR